MGLGLLLPVQSGGLRAVASERAVAPEQAVAPEGWALSPLRPDGVRVRRAVALPDAARRSKQRSILLGLGLGVRS